MTGTLTRPNANHILNIMRDDDLSDPWGTAMAWGFAVAEVLYDADPNMVPPELGYRPGIAGPEVPNGMDEPNRITLRDIPYETAAVYCWLHSIDEMADPEALDVNTLPYWSDSSFDRRAEELRFAAKCLHRYLEWCKAAGRDY